MLSYNNENLVPENSPHQRNTNWLPGESQDNPFARICCKTRTLIPVLCDGTCRSCNRAREGYKTKMIAQLIMKEEIRSGGDDEYMLSEVPSAEEAKEIVMARVARVEELKKIFFNQKFFFLGIDEGLATREKSEGATLH